MQICGQHFTQQMVDRIQETVDADPGLSRRELSRRVCEWMDWRKPDGKLKDMSCRKALSEMNRRGVLDLPDAPRPHGFENRDRPPDIQPPEVRCRLDQLGEIRIEPVESVQSDASRIWFAMMDQYHYLGGGPLCGSQIRYSIISEEYGFLGGLAFTSASFALKDRDAHIGWTENARRANLELVVNNARFLILPTVRVDNLASHALAQALCRLPQDWEKRYNTRPLLVETFVDPGRFKGSCYKAANFKCVGKTAGRRDGVSKLIFVHALSREWRQRLCKEPEVRLGEVLRPEFPDNWCEDEFGTVRLYDDRLKKRLCGIAQDFYESPVSGIPEASGSRARAVGAYRFFQNEKVTMDVILTPHCESAVERIKQHPVVLAPQDTTSLNYSAHPATEGLGPISTTDSVIGLILHDTVAFTESGVPLGVLDAQVWGRDPEDAGKKHRRKDLPIEEKESVKWLRSYRKAAEIQKLCPDTMIVSMGDRESDIYELFDEARQLPDGPELLVRAEKSRQRKVKSSLSEEDEIRGESEVKSDQDFLWDFMAKQPVSGTLKLHVPAAPSRKARDAMVDIRFAEVDLIPPKRYANDAPIKVWAVYVLERDLEDPNASPLEWMLLTTVETVDFKQAQKRVEWYSGRWGIEVYHRTLKSGCRIKDRQLRTADRLEACLGVDMVIAWRIYHLTMLGRDAPEVPCTAFFTDIEWKALHCYVNKTSTPPDEPPTMEEAIKMVGQMGGHLGRKGDGPPGTQTLWRGLQRLETAAYMYGVIHQEKNPQPHPNRSGP